MDDNTWIITGIPRSGTSLLASLICTVPNCYCANEIYYDINTLKRDLKRLRKRLSRGRAVPNKWLGDTVVTDTMTEGLQTGKRKINGIFDAHCLVASKVNVPYLFELENLLIQGFRIAALVRNPLYTIASWNLPTTHVPEAHPAKGRYAGWHYQGSNKYEHQAELWNRLAAILLNYPPEILLRYEDLVDTPEDILLRITGKKTEFGSLTSKNNEARYQHIPIIHAAIEKYAPLRREFGYK